MLNRPTRVQTFMEVAHAFAKRSTCMRRNVGAIIVQGRTIVGHGYNGSASGDPHCGGNECAGKHFCQLTIHAERNAIMRAGMLAKDADMYVTDSPCGACANHAHSWGVKRVFFAIPYRDTEPLDWLTLQGIAVYQVAPAGYVVEWATKNVVEVET